MTRFERATDPVDVFLARRSAQVQLRGTSRRSLPDYIFRGRRPDQYFIVECKGTQGTSSSAINQLVRAAEQVVTVGLHSPAITTHLVIGSLLSGSISLLIADPEENEEPPILSEWSTDDLSLFALAKKLSYTGDYAGASRLLSGLVEEKSDLEFADHEPDIRKTARDVFQGATEIRRTPDGRELRMFRGMTKIALSMAESAPIEEAASQETLDDRERPFVLESDLYGDSALVRSISPDGSLFEVEVR
jgi:hypothetical protein